MEEEEVVVVGREGDVLGLLGSQGGHNGGSESRADVEGGAGERGGAQQSAEVSHVVDLVVGDLRGVPAAALASSVHMQVALLSVARCRAGRNACTDFPLNCAW